MRGPISILEDLLYSPPATPFTMAWVSAGPTGCVYPRPSLTALSILCPGNWDPRFILAHFQISVGLYPKSVLWRENEVTHGSPNIIGIAINSSWGALSGIWPELVCAWRSFTVCWIWDSKPSLLGPRNDVIPHRTAHRMSTTCPLLFSLPPAPW